MSGATGHWTLFSSLQQTQARPVRINRDFVDCNLNVIRLDEGKEKSDVISLSETHPDVAFSLALPYDVNVIITLSLTSYFTFYKMNFRPHHGNMNAVLSKSILACLVTGKSVRNKNRYF